MSLGENAPYFIYINYFTKLYIQSHPNKHQNRLFLNIFSWLQNPKSEEQ